MIEEYQDGDVFLIRRRFGDGTVGEEVRLAVFRRYDYRIAGEPDEDDYIYEHFYRFGTEIHLLPREVEVVQRVKVVPA